LPLVPIDRVRPRGERSRGRPLVVEGRVGRKLKSNGRQVYLGVRLAAAWREPLATRLGRDAAPFEAPLNTPYITPISPLYRPGISQARLPISVQAD
jgi:hypothetical protein